MFLEAVYQYLRQAQETVRHHGNRQLVVILDNLDLVQEKYADHPGNAYADLDRFFLGQATSLLGVQCHAILHRPPGPRNMPRLQTGAHAMVRCRCIIPMIPCARPTEVHTRQAWQDGGDHQSPSAGCWDGF